jgi:two-component system cell cycle response regulator
MRRVMRRFLDSTGYVIFEAADGEEALMLAARERPDVILLDIQLPRLDGYGVLASLQADPQLGEVPVVLVTAQGEPEDVAEGLRRGAHDYLRKPFEQPELLARVHAAMRTKTLRDELHARSAALERLVSTDLLTGLLNRRAVEEQLRALVSRSRRRGAALSIVLIDVDRFRRINDLLGYATGDAVLQAVAERVRGALRGEDVAGRWGGEELLVLAPDTDAEGGAALAERLGGAVRAEPVSSAGGEVAVTVTTAVATWAGPDDDADAIVRRAEETLRAGQAAARDALHGSGG